MSKEDPTEEVQIALDLALFYLKNTNQEIKKDLQKTSLFRHCIKFIRETEIKPSDYKAFILAQLKIIDSHDGYVAPSVLFGKAAQNRWFVWKREVQKLLPEPKKRLDDDDVMRIAASMKKSLQFLQGIALTEAVADGRLQRWLYLNQVDGYFLACAGVEGIDLSVYQPFVDERVRNAFERVIKGSH